MDVELLNELLESEMEGVSYQVMDEIAAAAHDAHHYEPIFNAIADKLSNTSDSPQSVLNLLQLIRHMLVHGPQRLVDDFIWDYSSILSLTEFQGTDPQDPISTQIREDATAIAQLLKSPDDISRERRKAKALQAKSGSVDLSRRSTDWEESPPGTLRGFMDMGAAPPPPTVPLHVAPRPIHKDLPPLPAAGPLGLKLKIGINKMMDSPIASPVGTPKTQAAHVLRVLNYSIVGQDSENMARLLQQMDDVEFDNALGDIADAVDEEEEGSCDTTERIGVDSPVSVEMTPAPVAIAVAEG